MSLLQLLARDSGSLTQTVAPPFSPGGPCFKPWYVSQDGGQHTGSSGTGTGGRKLSQEVCKGPVKPLVKTEGYATMCHWCNVTFPTKI